MIGMLLAHLRTRRAPAFSPLSQYLTVLSRLGERHPRLKKAAYFARGLFSTATARPAQIRALRPACVCRGSGGAEALDGCSRGLGRSRNGLALG